MAAAAAVGAEVEDSVRDLKKLPGFTSYLILNNDGIVIKYENMSYKTAVHHAHQVLSLTGKASKYVRDLFDAPDNEVESVRLRTIEYEMVIAQHGNFTLVGYQSVHTSRYAAYMCQSHPTLSNCNHTSRACVASPTRPWSTAPLRRARGRRRPRRSSNQQPPSRCTDDSLDNNRTEPVIST